MNFHCLFEQSGSLKNVLISKGHCAYDYDIANEFNQTDFVINLFYQIEKEYDNILYNKKVKTIFTNLKSDNDFIIAFFPCTYFCDFNSLTFRLYFAGRKLDYDLKHCEMLIKRNLDRAYYFELFLKLCFICSYKGIKTIIENPASGGKNNYLVLFSPIAVSYYEKDRTLFGDYFKKPTNYFAINFDMKENFCMFCKNYNTKTVMQTKGMLNRSLINSLYFENFYDRFLKDKV